MRIAILTPTRGRPQRFAELLDAIQRTALDPAAITVFAGLDDDDLSYSTHGFQYEVAARPFTVRQVVRPRMRLAPWTNLLARMALDDGADILAFLGDDHRPRTPGWDELIRQSFLQHGSGLVYCRDGLQDERLPTAPFWSADVICALGWYYPPPLKHLYADNYWLTLANALDRRRYLPHVLIEHMHPSALGADGSPKGIEDDSYRESAALEALDRAAYEHFIRTEHPHVLMRVRQAVPA